MARVKTLFVEILEVVEPADGSGEKAGSPAAEEDVLFSAVILARKREDDVVRYGRNLLVSLGTSQSPHLEQEEILTR